jgi:alkylhydroperoxidase/carboxymuconolactone decarboxylase family protein YurZ
MQENEELRKKTEKILEATKKNYGFIPVVNQVLSERPDLFIPNAELSRAVLEGDGVMERKQRFLCAVAAATAIGGEYCVDVQMKHAIEAGATKDEVIESIAIGSMMAMTRAQSYALRKYAANFDVRID